MSNRNYKLDVLKRKQGNVVVTTYEDNNHIITRVYLHGNMVVNVDLTNRSVILDTCGWNTASTRDVMNTALRQLGVNAHVNKRKNTLNLTKGDGEPVTDFRATQFYF